MLFFSPVPRTMLTSGRALKFLWPYLRVASRHGNHCLWALLFHAPDILARFAVCKVRDRAGIYNVYIGCLLFPYDFIAAGRKLLLHGLRFVLVDFAAERVKCCFHVFYFNSFHAIYAVNKSTIIILKFRLEVYHLF